MCQFGNEKNKHCARASATSKEANERIWKLFITVFAYEDLQIDKPNGSNNDRTKGTLASQVEREIKRETDCKSGEDL